MRKLAVLCCAFGVGIGLGQWLVPTAYWLWMAVALFAVGCVCTLHKGKYRRHMVLGCCGIALALGHQWLYHSLWVAPAQNAVGQVLYDTVMTVEDYPTAVTYGAKVEVSVTLESGQTVRAMYYGDALLLEAVPQGTITDTVYLQSATVIDDTEITTFSSKSIHLLLYSRGDEVYTPPEGTVYAPLVLGQAIKTLILDLFETPYGGVVTAILTGDKTLLSDEISTDLTQAGIYHILAVSGMHCSFLLAIVVAFIGRQRSRLVALIAIPMLICFAILVGGSPSVVRACIMMVLLLIAPVCNRQGDPITALSVALAVILLQNPYAIASASLQMSFAAVAGIIWVSPKVYGLLVGEREVHRVWQFIAMNLAVSVGAIVFTAPISFWYFGTFWLVSPISNLLCVAAAGWVFAFGLLTLAVGAISLPLGLIVAWVPSRLIDYILAVCGVLGRLPYHAIYDANPYFYPWLLFCYAMALVVWRWSRRRRSVCLAMAMGGLTLIAIIVAGRWSMTSARVDGFAVDIGQGQCVVLESNGMTAVCDCGSGNSWVSAGDMAADYLQTMGCYSLDYLILSHYDSDHISGVEILLHRMEVATLYVSTLETDTAMGISLLEAAAAVGTKIVAVSELTQLPFGAGLLTIYPSVSESSSNDSGITVHCMDGDWDVLITGDLGAEAELALLEQYPTTNVDVWMVGHHGSDTSSDIDFLRTITPKVSIISVGDNSYGHPTAAVLQRLMAVGSNIYRTDLQGTVHFSN
ncbi:DNA internalization-related competence protein ComEC/Rec2 [Bengtsoniella intestinalis]|uniref:DNA internalization-related competence protein ComEC/Rec2 n=1 Tax=Bengtsoniella intestinalis TaxID=3073143 RepID=UPI00391EF075